MKLLVLHIVELLRGGESQPELSIMRRNHTESAFYVLYFDFNDSDYSLPSYYEAERDEGITSPM